MVDASRLAMPRQAVLVACVVAVCAVLPLFAIEAWSGFRLAQSDAVLSVIATTEQPLSVRSPGAPWAVLLALVWFGLAYWQRRMTLWEAALVVVGGAAVLARLGNAWLDGLAMIVPLARQLSLVRIKPALLVGLAAVSFVVTAYTLVTTRPPDLPMGAERAALAASSGTVFADWRWAPALQRQLGASREVRAGGGPASEPNEFWVDYLRIVQGHERWSEALQRMNADLVVLDTAQAKPAAELVRHSSDWRVMFDADGALVAVKATP